MKTLSRLCWSILLAGLLAAPVRADEAPWQMTVQTDKPGAKINPSFYGLMTEEINHAFDGGLYAELIQNRVFKDNDHDPVHWLPVQDGGGAGTMSIDKTTPLNPALPNSLKLEVSIGGKRVGVANEGFCNYSKKGGGRDVKGPGGLPVKPDTTYKVTFYARSASGISSVNVDLESADGNTVYAQSAVNGIGGEWHRFTLDLKTGANVTPSLDNPGHAAAGFVVAGCLTACLSKTRSPGARGWCAASIKWTTTGGSCGFTPAERTRARTRTSSPWTTPSRAGPICSPRACGWVRPPCPTGGWAGSSTSSAWAMPRACARISWRCITTVP